MSHHNLGPTRASPIHIPRVWHFSFTLNCAANPEDPSLIAGRSAVLSVWGGETLEQAPCGGVHRADCKRRLSAQPGWYLFFTSVQNAGHCRQKNHCCTFRSGRTEVNALFLPFSQNTSRFKDLKKCLWQAAVIAGGVVSSSWGGTERPGWWMVSRSEGARHGNELLTSQTRQPVCNHWAALRPTHVTDKAACM